MNTNEVIESYVADVAVQLPRRQRNDVAFELRALLNEGLQDRAEAAGRSADAAMATEFLRGFGRPEEVAARYRPVLNVIDPADGHAFLRATVIGLLVIWTVGLLIELQQPLDSGSDMLVALGHWWTSTVLASMWWPGVLVVGFATSSWIRRQWPLRTQWKPRAGDRIGGGRASLALGVVGIVCGLSVLIDPRWLLDVVWSGRAAPAAYEALTYTDAFLRRQGPCLFVLLALNIPLMITVIAKGCWSANTRRMETTLGLATCAVMAWTVIDGPIFATTVSDQTTKFFMVLIIAFILVDMGVKLHRSVRPAPDQHSHVHR